MCRTLVLRYVRFDLLSLMWWFSDTSGVDHGGHHQQIGQQVAVKRVMARLGTGDVHQLRESLVIENIRASGDDCQIPQTATQC